MITLAGKTMSGIKQFRGLSSDVTANKHLPNAEGKLDGVVVGNGDELAIMDGAQDVYLYDLENKVWLKQ